MFNLIANLKANVYFFLVENVLIVKTYNYFWSYDNTILKAGLQGIKIKV